MSLTEYQEEVLDQLDYVTEEKDGFEDKYRAECGYCGKVFESDSFEKVINREGVHRSTEHVKDGKIVCKKGYTDKKCCLVDIWEGVDGFDSVIDIIWWTTPTQVNKKRYRRSNLLEKFI